MNDDERRKFAAATVAALVDGGIAVAVVALMLKVTRQQVYRWLSGGWLPRLAMCGPIGELAKRAEVVRADWAEVVGKWDRPYTVTTRLVLYQPEPLGILNGQLENDKKIAQLVSLTFALWAEKGAR